MWHGHFCPGMSSITIFAQAQNHNELSFFLGLASFWYGPKASSGSWHKCHRVHEGYQLCNQEWQTDPTPFQCHFPVLSLSQPDDLCGSNTARTPFPGNVCGRAFYLKECSGPENYVIMIVLKNVWSWEVRSGVVSWEIRESCTTFLRNNCRSKTVKIATDRLLFEAFVCTKVK